jgi:DNA-binding PadR family transcriptional regulator
LLQLKEGSLYPALYRLEEAGEIGAVWEKETQGRRGPRGRIYHLTKKGQRKLAQGRVEWQTFVATLGEILLNAPA